MNPRSEGARAVFESGATRGARQGWTLTLDHLGELLGQGVSRRLSGEMHHASRPRQIQCGACRLAFDDTAWQSLDLAQRIDAGEVSRMVRGWSSNECVEVRQCACGKRIASRRIVSASPPTKLT
jgi:hypothetical protein